MKERRRRGPFGFLHDENGSKSMGRLLMVAWSGFTAFVIVADSGPLGWDVPVPVYALLGTIFTGLLAWVAVPRAVQQMSGVAGAIRGVMSGFGGFGELGGFGGGPAFSDPSVPMGGAQVDDS